MIDRPYYTYTERTYYDDYVRHSIMKIDEDSGMEVEITSFKDYDAACGVCDSLNEAYQQMQKVVK